MNVKNVFGGQKYAVWTVLSIGFALGASAVEPDEAVASVTTNGVTTVYGDINDAWSGALVGTEANPATLKLLADVKLTSCLSALSPTFDGRNVTFDLNDHVLSPADTGYSLISFSSVNGSFALVDTATTKTKKYFTETPGGLWTLTNETTSLFVEGGVITGGKSGRAVDLGNGAAVEIRDVSFVGNGSSGDCGALYVDAAVNVYSTRFYGNRAKSNGAAICGMNDGRFLLANCDVRHNVAGNTGGGVYVKNKCVLVNTTISDNVATNHGAGVYFEKKVGCLAAGTKILMADGTEKVIEDVVAGDLVTTFDHEGGTNSSSRIYLAYAGPAKSRPFTLEFDTPLSNLQPSTSNLSLTIADLHDLLEETSRKYVRITAANAATFVGKRFYGRDGTWHTLTGATFGTEEVSYYSIYSAQHQNVYANGLLTAPDDADHMLNLYELDAGLKADPECLAADIATYGLADPDRAAEHYGVDRQYFDDGNLKYLYVAIGKGLVTLEKLVSDFQAIGGGSATAPDVMPAPKMVKAMMLGATPSEPKLTDFESFGTGVLVLGANAVVTNNFVGAITNSNIHLANADSKIALAEAHAGILAGVALASGIGQFTKTNNVSVADVALFTSDDPEYAVRFDASGTFLKLGYAGIQVGDDAWARVVDGLCTVVGTGDMWSHDNPSNSPLWSLKGAITRVVVGGDVTGIGKNDFSYMGALKDVEIGNSVTQVAEKAFYRCTYATNLVVGAYVTTVGAAAFERCYSLETFRFGSQETALACQDAFKIVARITMDGETPVVDAVPEVSIEGWNRELQGKTNLTDAVWVPIDETKPIPYGFHFFKYAFVLPPE